MDPYKIRWTPGRLGIKSISSPFLGNFTFSSIEVRWTTASFFGGS